MKIFILEVFNAFVHNKSQLQRTDLLDFSTTLELKETLNEQRNFFLAANREALFSFPMDSFLTSDDGSLTLTTDRRQLTPAEAESETAVSFQTLSADVHPAGVLFIQIYTNVYFILNYLIYFDFKFKVLEFFYCSNIF